MDKENKVYYGEYSLIHWINLMLKKNIVLPKYQRSFVWNKDKLKQLMETFKGQRFVPPVTIGAFDREQNVENWIIDGQQRLTSVLLAFLGYFPNKEEFKKIKNVVEESPYHNFIDENNDENDDEENENRIEWTFQELTKVGKTADEIKKEINTGKYKSEITNEQLYEKLDIVLDDNFFKNHFLGFSYIVPEKDEAKSQKTFFSTIFRDINILGSTLSLQESRRSLYYLEDDMNEYFEPKFLKGLGIDFVRYLAFLSQYSRTKNTDNIAMGYSKKLERYYEDYIFSSIWEESPKQFVSVSELFEKRNYIPDLSSLEESLNKLGFLKKYTSIIEQDMYLIGAIYFILFQKKVIDISKKDELKENIDKKIEVYKQDNNKSNYNHIKNPSAFKYLRERIHDSIEIYEEYINENT